MKKLQGILLTFALILCAVFVPEINANAAGSEDYQKDRAVVATKNSYTEKIVKEHRRNISDTKTEKSVKVTYKNVTEGSLKKYIKVTQNGSFTFKRGAKPGIYKIQITETDASGVKKSTKIMTIELE